MYRRRAPATVAAVIPVTEPRTVTSRAAVETHIASRGRVISVWLWPSGLRVRLASWRPARRRGREPSGLLRRGERRRCKWRAGRGRTLARPGGLGYSLTVPRKRQNGPARFSKVLSLPGAACRNRTDDLFITRVVRTAWTSAKPPGDPHERSIRVPRCPATCTAIVTQLDTQADRCPDRP
jgi:hypothetical protein